MHPYFYLTEAYLLLLFGTFLGVDVEGKKGLLKVCILGREQIWVCSTWKIIVFCLMCEGFQTNMMFSPLEMVHRNDRAT